jgi:hypothetical protein
MFYRLLGGYVGIAISLVAPAHAEDKPDKWTRAEKEIVRYPPERFNSLPQPVKAFIRSHGCTIPQSADFVATGSPPMNVVAGAFGAVDQKDWAILCSQNGHSSILVYWGGKSRCKTPIADEPDRNSLQGLGVDLIGYSRELGRVDPAGIRYTYHHDNEDPPTVDHDAIDDAFGDKASIRYYCDGATWKVLAGAD